jgi:hypothetical protein
LYFFLSYLCTVLNDYSPLKFNEMNIYALTTDGKESTAPDWAFSAAVKDGGIYEIGFKRVEVFTDGTYVATWEDVTETGRVYRRYFAIMGDYGNGLIDVAKYQNFSDAMKQFHAGPFDHAVFSHVQEVWA